MPTRSGSPRRRTKGSRRVGSVPKRGRNVQRRYRALPEPAEQLREHDALFKRVERLIQHAVDANRTLLPPDLVPTLKAAIEAYDEALARAEARMNYVNKHKMTTPEKNLLKLICFVHGNFEEPIKNLIRRPQGLVRAFMQSKDKEYAFDECYHRFLRHGFVRLRIPL